MTEFTPVELPDENERMVVSEEVVQTAATICGPESSFQRALDLGKKYREAGLEPIYITDYEYKMIWVTYTAESSFH